MKGKELRGCHANGSYTVEAALVFPVILFVFLALLYMIFYLHDMYILQIYGDRMAQECCFLYLESEHMKEPPGSEAIIAMVSKKYEPELQRQLLMTQISACAGTLNKSLITNVYTAVWRISGRGKTLFDLSGFHVFAPVTYEARYERVYARHWIYKYHLLSAGGS